MNIDLKEFVKPELLILIPILCIIGTVMKKTGLKDVTGAVILGTISVILSGIWVFANCKCVCFQEIMIAVFTSLTQGILIAGASVLCERFIKIDKSGKSEKKSDDKDVNNGE